MDRPGDVCPGCRDCRPGETALSRRLGARTPDPLTPHDQPEGKKREAPGIAEPQLGQRRRQRTPEPSPTDRCQRRSGRCCSASGQTADQPYELERRSRRRPVGEEDNPNTVTARRLVRNFDPAVFSYSPKCCIARPDPVPRMTPGPSPTARCQRQLARFCRASDQTADRPHALERHPRRRPVGEEDNPSNVTARRLVRNLDPAVFSCSLKCCIRPDPPAHVKIVFSGDTSGSVPEVSPQIEHPAPCIVAASYPLCLSREGARKRAPTGLAVPP